MPDPPADVTGVAVVRVVGGCLAHAARLITIAAAASPAIAQRAGFPAGELAD